MGYTHYWKGIAQLDSDLEKKLSKLIAHGINSEVLSTDSTVSGTGGIWINGIDEDSYEDFTVTWGINSAFSFCKTNHKLYDIYVVAALILITQYNVNKFEWSSDGNNKDFEYAQKLVKELFPI